MTIPDYQTIMLPFLKLARDNNEHRFRVTVNALADHFHLTEDERKELLPSGQQPLFNNRVGWARLYLIKAELLEATRRGYFQITELGHSALKQGPDKIDNNFLMQFPGFVAAKKKYIAKDKQMALFTIGYEKLNQKQFMAHLSYHSIDVVADIRKLPVSRKKGFSKTALGKTLNHKGIDYLNYQALGAPKELRDELYKSGNYDRFFRKYENNISEKTNYLADILSLINQGRSVALLCFERNPEKCHRKVVAEQIRKLDGNGLKVEHIVPI